MPVALFEQLFESLETRLNEDECDHTLLLTEAWLEEMDFDECGEVLDWLADHGGVCDCEVLASVTAFLREDYY